MNPPFLPNKSLTKTRAFTLVEITLALGIVAFAMLVTLGMNSTAVQSFGDTRRATVYANILQYVDASANSTPFKSINDTSSDATQALKMAKKTMLFDAEGLYLGILDTATDTGSSTVPDNPVLANRQIVYRAKLAVDGDNVVGTPDPTMPLPGVSSPSPATKNIKVTITDSGTTTSNPAIFHIVIGDLGK